MICCALWESEARSHGVQARVAHENHRAGETKAAVHRLQHHSQNVVQGEIRCQCLGHIAYAVGDNILHFDGGSLIFNDIRCYGVLRQRICGHLLNVRRAPGPNTHGVQSWAASRRQIHSRRAVADFNQSLVNGSG